MKNKYVALVILISILIPACTSATTTTVEPSPLPPTVTLMPAATSTATLIPDPPALPIDLTEVGPITPTLPINTITHFGFTYQQADGNRIAYGVGSVGKTNPIDIQLGKIPRWVVGVPIDGGGSIWSVVFDDGEVQSFMHLLDEILEIKVLPDRLPPGMPPALVIHRGAPRLLTAPEQDASPLTHPVVIQDDPANFAYIAKNGDLVLDLAGNKTRIAVNALPDARILQDEGGRLMLLTGATDRYSHGVLGDSLEAENITIIDTETRQIEIQIDVSPRVVEGISPIWSDLDGDGEREIIVTLSDANMGGQVVVYSESGELLAEGPAIGRGFRWRHQLAAVAFIENEAPVLVDNLTPHIGGITEFYRYDLDEGLVVASSTSGFSSHRIGSRNLDMVLAGDLNGDGIIELLIPSESGENLGAFQFSNDRSNIGWTVRIPAKLSTNIGAVTTLDGKLLMAAGFENRVLRLWLP